MRVIQHQGTRGSLKWIQRAANERWSTLDQPDPSSDRRRRHHMAVPPRSRRVCRVPRRQFPKADRSGKSRTGPEGVLARPRTTVGRARQDHAGGRAAAGGEGARCGDVFPCQRRGPRVEVAQRCEPESPSTWAPTQVARLGLSSSTRSPIGSRTCTSSGIAVCRPGWCS